MNVLVGIEGSEESVRALDRAVERALDADDRLTVATFAKDGQSIEAIERRVHDRLEAAGIDAEIRRLDGEHPASELLSVAESGEFDQLVIGGGHRSPMGKIELGPITEFVLLNAQITVRLVR